MMRIHFALGLTIGTLACQGAPRPAGQGLWGVYEQSLKGAKYIDLTHTITPSIPVWRGFGPIRAHTKKEASRPGRESGSSS